jgi:hypothetical protein
MIQTDSGDINQIRARLRRLTPPWSFHEPIASIGCQCTAHDFATDWHPMIRTGVSANQSVKFASLDFYIFADLANRIIRHLVHSIRKSSPVCIVNVEQSLLGGFIMENSAGVF